MSSILEALREVEGNEAPSTQHAEPWTEPPRTLRRTAWALAVIGVVAAGGAAVVLLRARGAPDRVAKQAATQPAPTANALPPAAPAAPAAALPANAEPPRGRVEPWAPTAPALADAPERPVPRTAVRRSPPPADTPPSETPPRPPGEPRVQLTSLSYSPVPAERAVALTINGVTTGMLHEGQSASGVEVKLILSDRVYLRHAGAIFAVHAPD
jgi:hypothetical protein